MMNRQLRRAQDKKDRLKEREKERSREERRAKIARRRTRRRTPKPRPQANEDAPKTRRTQPGRFAGVFTVATGVFIVLQALVPISESEGLSFTFAVEVLYYLLFGYFVATWLMRRGRPRAFELAAGVGVGLALLLQVVTAALGLGLDALLLAFAVPAALLGAWLGRFVYLRAP